jgi:hypothetical protein
MKTFIWTITALITATLVLATPSSCQSTAEKETQETLAAAKADAQAAASEAQQQAQEALTQADVAQKQADILAQQLHPDALAYSRSVAATVPTGESFSINLLQHAAQSILVIPLDEIKVEDLAAITEDIGIMCRVLDKKLEQEARITTRRTLLPFGGDIETEGIYLEGYGALFVLNVNLPLIPPPETKKEEQPKEEGDTFWEETRNELHSTKESGAFAGGGYGGGVYGGGGYGGVAKLYTYGVDRSSENYDPEKVEQLKTTLIRSLKHAANIRNLKPDESVIISVRGCAPGVVVQETVIEKNADRGSTTSRSGSVGVSRRAPVLRTLPAEEGNAASTVLTIRAKKSEIDAFAKGQATFDQFRQKVCIHTH